MYTKEQVEEHVKSAIDDMCGHLADRWNLKHGDVDPMMSVQWEDETVPQIVDFMWHMYEGNQPAFSASHTIEALKARFPRLEIQDSPSVVQGSPFLYVYVFLTNRGYDGPHVVLSDGAEWDEPGKILVGREEGHEVERVVDPVGFSSFDDAIEAASMLIRLATPITRRVAVFAEAEIPAQVENDHEYVQQHPETIKVTAVDSPQD